MDLSLGLKNTENRRNTSVCVVSQVYGETPQETNSLTC